MDNGREANDNTLQRTPGPLSEGQNEQIQGPGLDSSSPGIVLADSACISYLGDRSPGSLGIPLHEYGRDSISGLGIGFTDDGRVVLAAPSYSSEGCPEQEIRSSPLIVDQVGGLQSKLSRQNTEVIELAPKAREDGMHYEELQNIFQRVDSNGDGLITNPELVKALQLSARNNKVKLEAGVVQEVVNLIFQEVDPDRKGTIELQQLNTVMYGHRTYSGSSSAPSKSNYFLMQAVLGQNMATDRTRDSRERPAKSDWLKGLLFSRTCREEAWFFLQNNWRIVLVLLLWLAVNAALFPLRYVTVEVADAYSQTAFRTSKGAAEVVKFNTGLILVCACKWTISLLRGTGLSRVIPFDERLELHKLAAAAVLLAGAVHSGGHLFGNYVHLARGQSESVESAVGEEASLNYWDLLGSRNAVSGFILWAILLPLATLATNAFRAFCSRYGPTSFLGGFGAFWWSHCLLFPCFLFFLFYHGSHRNYRHFPTTDTWAYLVGPFFLYVAEKVVKAFRTRYSRRSLDVVRVECLPGKVLALHFSKPPFKFKSGMYVFIRCPAVAPLEWHPFSITSAPSDAALSLHIRAVGNWTRAMLAFWEKEMQRSQEWDRAHFVDQVAVDVEKSSGASRKYRYPRVLVDGPHGAPTQDYENFHVVMLVGAGIGVTPMASVIRDVLHKAKHRQQHPKFTIDKVHFFWTTREQENFEWFVEMMAQTASEDEAGVVDMHTYLTSAHGDDDPRSFLLKAAQDRYHAKTGHDIITKARAKIATHFARPHWDTIFSTIQQQTPNTTIGVFLCGPRALQKELHDCCQRYTTNATNGTTFVFRSENF